MLLSRNWMASYVELPEDIPELSARLTAAGFNVEGVEESGDDVGLDMEITTNRSDAMNHLGMARELAVIFDRGGRELPIQPDYCGRVVDVDDCEKVKVKWLEEDGEDAVYVLTK